jgi:fucose permease
VAEPVNYLFVGLMMLFFFLFVGVEVSYSGWIYTYAVETGLADKTMAAYLNSTFWLAFTIGRLIGIPIAARYRPRNILLVDLLGCIVSVAIVLIWPTSALVLWIGVAGAGFAMASVFAVTLSWAERRVHITGFITSCFFIGTSTGAMFFPWFIGQLFEAYGPHVTMLTIFVTDIGALGIFVLLMIYGGQPRRQTVG